MRKIHYISIVAALALIAVLYWGINTKPIKDADAAKPMANAETSGATPSAASFDSIKLASIQLLPAHAVEEIKALEQQAAEEQDNSQKATLYGSIAQLWQEHKQMPVAAYYYAEEGKLESSEKKLNFAGQLFLSLMHNLQDPSMQMWAAEQGISCLERSLEINPDNDTTKIALASGYVDGTAQPMKGIQLLLGITREEPDNVAANLMLGKMSIRSAQYQKALGRFETVLKKEPNNTEAMYMLAVVYKELGRKEEAIELLEKCKKNVDNPEFTADIDAFIKTFK